MPYRGKEHIKYYSNPILPYMPYRSMMMIIIPIFSTLQVKEELIKYYGHLKKVHVRTAFDHWNYLYTDSIRSEKLRENFRKVYCAYSPHKEEDVFVITPWIPGPSYTYGHQRSHTPTQQYGSTGTSASAGKTRAFRCTSSQSRPSSRISVNSRPHSMRN